MKKVFKFKLPDTNPVEVALSYPSFVKEKLASLFPILDWITFISYAVFFFLLFVPGTFGLVGFSEKGFVLWIYSFVILLFGIQLVRFLLGGISYYPKTFFDIPILTFIAAIVISILFSKSQFNLVLGENNLRMLSGFSHLALLLLYYFSVSEVVITKNKSKLLFFVLISLLTMNFFVFENSFAGILDYSSVLLLAIPLFYFLLVGHKNVLIKLLAFFNIFFSLLNLNLSNFSLSLSLLLTLIVSGVVYYFTQKKQIAVTFDKFLDDFVENIKIKKLRLYAFLKKQGLRIVYVLFYFFMTSFSIVKSVENFIGSEKDDLVGAFNRTFNKLENPIAWIFGVGLARPTGAFYSDILSNFGLIALITFLIMAGAVIFFSIKSLKKAQTDKFYILSALSFFIGLLIFGLFNSFAPFAYISMWLTIILLSLPLSQSIDQKLETNILEKFSDSKYKDILRELRMIILLAVIVGTVILLMYLNQNFEKSF
jgi:hypothetical protein